MQLCMHEHKRKVDVIWTPREQRSARVSDVKTKSATRYHASRSGNTKRTIVTHWQAVTRACRSNSFDNRHGIWRNESHLYTQRKCAAATQTTARWPYEYSLPHAAKPQPTCNERGKPVCHLERCRVGAHPRVWRWRRRRQPMTPQAPLLEAPPGGVRGGGILRRYSG